MRPVPPARRNRNRTSRFRSRKYLSRSVGTQTRVSYGRGNFTGIVGLPLPPKFKTSLTYVQEGVTAGGAGGSLSNFQYALNSVYDPYVTAGGHQPMGYDQMMAFYQFCRVDKAHITVEFTPGTGTGNPPHVGVQFTENSSYSPSDLSTILERGNVSYAIMPNVAGFSGKKIIVKRSWDASKWYPTYQKFDESFANTASAGPSGELAYANIFAIGPSGGTYTDCYYVIRIKFDVEFYGQLQLNQS